MMFPTLVMIAVVGLMLGAGLLLLSAISGRRMQRLESRVTGLAPADDG